MSENVTAIGEKMNSLEQMNFRILLEGKLRSKAIELADCVYGGRGGGGSGSKVTAYSCQPFFWPLDLPTSTLGPQLGFLCWGQGREGQGKGGLKARKTSLSSK